MMTKEDMLHPWKESRNFHPEDEMLRQHGFTIYARAKDQEPVWTKGGVLFTHQDAVARINGKQLVSP